MRSLYRPHSPRARKYFFTPPTITHPLPITTSSSSPLIRLQKVLRDRFGVSRRHAEEWIEKGFVTVNREKADLGKKVDPEKDIIMLDPSLNIKPLPHPLSRGVVADRGVFLSRGVPEGRGVLEKNISPENSPTSLLSTVNCQLSTSLVLALHKPAGYVTTRFDPQKRPTIYELIPERFHNLFPVGRLDMETEGLILLTDDGDLCFQLTHPKFEVEKEYYTKTTRPVLPEDVDKIRKGLKNEEIETAPCEVTVLNPQEMILILREGQKREIRRMFISLGYHVFYLKRIRFASIDLDRLARGKWRELDQKEVEFLKKPRVPTTNKK